MFTEATYFSTSSVASFLTKLVDPDAKISDWTGFCAKTFHPFTSSESSSVALAKMLNLLFYIYTIFKSGYGYSVHATIYLTSFSSFSI